MVKLEALNQAIKDSGIKLGVIASRLHISRNGLWKKLHGINGISLEDAQIIARTINLTDDQKIDIFLP